MHYSFKTINQYNKFELLFLLLILAIHIYCEQDNINLYYPKSLLEIMNSNNLNNPCISNLVHTYSEFVSSVFFLLSILWGYVFVVRIHNFCVVTIELIKYIIRK